MQVKKKDLIHAIKEKLNNKILNSPESRYWYTVKIEKILRIHTGNFINNFIK